MSNGKTFASKMDQALDTLDRESQAIAGKADALRQKRAQLTGEIATAYLEIARHHVDAVAAAEIQNNDAIARLASKRLESRRKEEATLQGQLKQAEQALTNELGLQEQAAEQRDSAASRVIEIQAKVEAELSQNEGHRRLITENQNAEKIAAAAEERAKLVERERREKSAAYDGDRVFTYLANRKFGTDAYQAGALVRAIDGWLARMCNYRQSSRDYALLQSLPQYMSRHALKMRNEAAAAAKTVENALSLALKVAGLERASQDLAKKEARFQLAVKHGNEAREKLRRKRDELIELSQWRDRASAGVLREMALAFGREGIDALLAHVAATATTRDDELASQISQAHDEVARIDHRLSQLDIEERAVRDKVMDLKTVRKKYRSQGYDSTDYDVRGQSPTDLLNGFILGTVASDALWRGVNNAVTYSPPPTYSGYSSSSSSSSSDSGFGGSSSFSSGGGFGGDSDSYSTGGGF